jgi:hypothetical protein
MRRVVLLTLLLGLILIALPACGPRPASVALGQDFSLKLGQSAAIANEGVTLTFDAVQEDSRCPTGAT